MALCQPCLALQEEQVKASISLAQKRAGDEVPLSCTCNGISRGVFRSGARLSRLT